MSAVILQLHAHRRDAEGSREPSYAIEHLDPPERTAQAIYNCLKSLLLEAEHQGLKTSSAALRLAIEVVAVDLKP